MNRKNIIYLLLLLIPINIFAAKAEINSLDWSFWNGYTTYKNEIDSKYEENIQTRKEEAFSWFTPNQVYTTYNNVNEEYTIKRMKEKYPDKPDGFFDEPRNEEEYYDDYLHIFIESFIMQEQDYFGSYYNYLWTYFYDKNYKEVDAKMDYYKTHFDELKEDYLEDLFNDYTYEITELYAITSSLDDLKKYDEAFEEFYIFAYLYKEYPITEENIEELANYEYEFAIYNEVLIDGESIGSIYFTGNGKDDNTDNNIPVNYWDDPVNYGIQNTFKIGNHEEKLGWRELNNTTVDYSYKYITRAPNGITYDKPGFGKLVISAKNITNTKVEITYKLTNYTGVNTTYGLSNMMYNYINDTGEEYYVSTEIKDNHYVVTNYYEESENAYGAQLLITPNKPTTRHLGNAYYIDDDGILKHHFINRFKNSELTKAIDDAEGNALDFSWQGNIKSGETITHTVIYELVSSEDVEVEFIPLQGNKTTVQTIDGAALEIPNSITEQGSNIKWYTNPEGTGESYLPEEITLVHSNTPKYYEIKKTNTVVVEKNNNSTIINPEDLKLQLQNDLNTANDDVKLVLNISNTNPEQNEKDLINEKIKSNQTLGSYLNIDLFKVVNNSTQEPIVETTKELEIELSIPQELINTNNKTNRTYQILRLHDDEVEVLDTQLKNGKLIFKTNKFSTYAIVYADEIVNPQTGDNLIKFIIISLISLISISTCYYVLKHN